MQNYELVTIISPEVNDERVLEVVDKMNQLISDKEGVVEGTERWGMKKLAYPIKRFMEGNYIVTLFKLEPKFVKELETNLRASEEVLRHLVVKVGD